MADNIYDILMNSTMNSMQGEFILLIFRYLSTLENYY